ncbi:hypothetical protein [Paraglaciecola mesophila]|uniref:hypothetical protein n=1 Tax=Paraglaciecola mesophila TaxID=197222 RepID=UPI0013632939|nr:hypothetical protein [Paraglaciecola mesophila]
MKTTQIVDTEGTIDMSMIVHRFSVGDNDGGSGFSFIPSDTSVKAYHPRRLSVLI